MTSFGEELRRERELRQVSLREVAEATKVNLRYLEALERNDFEHLPGGVFNRGFVRAYAQYIGIDADAMVSAYLVEEQTQSERSQRRAEGVLRSEPRGQPRAVPRPAAPEARRRAPRKVWIWITIALLLAAAAGAVWFASTKLTADSASSGRERSGE